MHAIPYLQILLMMHTVKITIYMKLTHRLIIRLALLACFSLTEDRSIILNLNNNGLFHTLMDHYD